MGYAYYEIIRPSGDRIAAGYSVEAICEEGGCKAKIDRGLAYLCGKDPRGDDHGCGGYFCEQHLYGDNQCKRCSKAADEANRWVHPETGEEFDLRDHFLPAGSTYDARGEVWRHFGERVGGIPVLHRVHASDFRPSSVSKLITEGEWEDAGRIIRRQFHAA